MLLYLFCGVETHKPVSFGFKVVAFALDQCGSHSQVGSLAGAAHLLNDNTGDLRSVQCERKSHVEFKGKS